MHCGHAAPWRRKLTEEEIPPDLFAMGALMFSLAGVSMHMKGAAWAGVICATGVGHTGCKRRRLPGFVTLNLKP